jgi:hypothetical protein
MENFAISSLSLDVVALIVFGIGLIWYVYKQGVKQIVILHLALYPALAITPLIDINVSSLGPVAGRGVVFITILSVIWFTLRQSPLGQTLATSKSNKNIQYIYTISVLAALLSILFPFLQLARENSLTWIESSLFSRSYLTVVWYTLPLVILYFIKSSKKK